MKILRSAVKTSERNRRMGFLDQNQFTHHPDPNSSSEEILMMTVLFILFEIASVIWFYMVSSTILSIILTFNLSLIRKKNQSI